MLLTARTESVPDLPWCVALYRDPAERAALWRYCPDVMRVVQRGERPFLRGALIWLMLFVVAERQWWLMLDRHSLWFDEGG